MKLITDLKSIIVLFVITIIISPISVSADTNSTEAKVREYFKDIPVMIEIARCESKFKQYDIDGTALRGGWNGNMVGVFQFYKAIHNGTANLLGFNLDKLEGNLAYARHLYTESGTTPWNSSKDCWINTSVPTPTTTVVSTIVNTDNSLQQARIELLRQVIAQLQILLANRLANT